METPHGAESSLKKDAIAIYKAVLAFIVHAVGGTVIFVVLAGLAFGLGQFVRHLGIWGADAILVECLGALEYVIFGADALCMLFFIYSAVKAAYKEMSK
ncbi:hypothetical protein NDK50_08145 [Paraburkholderia bryophila]|uniref:hypothetical protein n=1 Tax=Paraburkholderia bryophila TaxID=420952 RepID=UPI0023497062|nr:hypothetical protein [Paraburkholderia bryophila]WCM21407.1 hypothetical protein NDK50_08145 [Paraburkholderia bryophila]